MQGITSRIIPVALGLSVMTGSIMLGAASAAAVPVRNIAMAAELQNSLVHEARSRRGAAVAAGVLGGLAVGAMIGAATAAPPPPPPPPGYYDGRGYYVDDDWYAYCASKYRSFDPATGTFMGYDGIRRPCQ
jgi:hypothetical protein